MIAKETISMHKDVAKKYEAGRIMYHVSISHECYGDVLKSSLCTSRTFFSYKRVCASSQKGIACDWIVLFASRRSKQTRNTFQRKKKMKMNDKHYHWRWKRIGYSLCLICRSRESFINLHSTTCTYFIETILETGIWIFRCVLRCDEKWEGEWWLPAMHVQQKNYE